MVKQRRASGFRQILGCFKQIYECMDPTGSDGEPKLRNSIKAIEAYCSNATLDSETRVHLRSVFQVFHELIEEDRATFEDNDYTGTKTFSPLELFAVCCLISQKGDERPKGMLRGDILALRAHLREIYRDLRLNKACWLTAWNFIDRLEYYRGAIDGSSVRKEPRKIKKKKPRQQLQVSSSTDHGSVVPARKDFLVRNANKEQQKQQSRTPNNYSSAKIPSRATSDSQDQQVSGESLVSQLTAAAALDTMNRNHEDQALSRTSNNIESTMTPPPHPVIHRGTGINPRTASRLETSASTVGVTSGELIISHETALSSPRMSSISSVSSSTFAENAVGQPNPAAPIQRKRTALHLDYTDTSMSTSNQDLESKRARLMAGFVKQEKDP